MLLSVFAHRHFLRFTTFALLLLGIVNLTEAAPRSVTVRVDRWLSVQQRWGTVTFQSQGRSRSAQQGDRLQAVGDAVTTGQQSGAVLAVDTGVGFIRVGENTQIKIRALDIAADNGRITLLDVPYGQVRLQVRPFTHKGSRLEIRTPAGVSAVRGTVFGMSVQPNGKTGLATLNGAVTTTAQGKAVLVPGGFQNLILVGEPPSAAVPLRDDTTLRYQLERTIDGGIRKLRLNGQVDPVNTVLIGEIPQATDRNGRFSVDLQAVSLQSLQVTVITPLGRRQVHAVSIRL